MAGLKRFPYAIKDYDELVEKVKTMLREIFGEKAWNDFEADNSGMMLIHAFIYVHVMLSYYVEHQANESFFATAKERQNLIDMCKLIAYTPAGAQPAQADITVSITDAKDTDVTLPSGSQIESQGGIVFETTEDAVIPAGELSTVVAATQGETYDETVGISTGKAEQQFYLQRSGVLEILEITVGGAVWQATQSLMECYSEDKVYMAWLDAWGRCVIAFGDGEHGQVPATDDIITATYRVGGGTVGNIAPNTLTNVREIATDELGNRVPITVTNENWAAGGAEPESEASIKHWAPLTYQAQDRCVTEDDYEAMTMAFHSPSAGRIAKVHAVCHERSGEANIIRLYVLSYGTAAGTVANAPEALKLALLNHLNAKKMLTDYIEIADGTWREVPITGTVTISAGFKASAVRTKIDAALEELMDVESREMGEVLRISDLYAAIDNVQGVDHVELETPTATVAAEANELLLLGDVNLSIKTSEATGYGKNI